MPCFMLLETSHQFIGYAVMRPTSNAIDMTNQNAGSDGLRLAGMLFIAKIITGTMPAMRQFMDSNSGKKVSVSERL